MGRVVGVHREEVGGQAASAVGIQAACGSVGIDDSGKAVDSARESRDAAAGANQVGFGDRDGSFRACSSQVALSAEP